MFINFKPHWNDRYSVCCAVFKWRSTRNDRLLGVLFALAGTIAALWSEELKSTDRWLMGANVILFAAAVVIAIIKVALHAN